MSDVDVGVPGRRLGDDPPLTVADLEQVDAVVTGCAVAIAETGPSDIELDRVEGVHGPRTLHIIAVTHEGVL